MIGKINFRIGLLAATLGAAAAFVIPMIAGALAFTQEVAPASQSASGKVASVAAGSFSLEVKSGDASLTIQFVTDANTKMSGKLETGAMATVEYKTDANGKNVATSVVVKGKA